MELEKVLQNIGFSDKESEIYLLLHKTWTYWAGKIARTLWKNRGTTYALLKEMINKNILTQTTKNGIQEFSCIPPENLLFLQQQKTQELKKAIPFFEQQQDINKNSSQIEYYEWNSGIIAMYNDILNSQVEIKAFLWSLELDKEIQKYFKTHFFPTKKKKKIRSKTILTTQDKKAPLWIERKLYRERKHIPWLNFKEYGIINIYWPNKIMFVNFETETPIGFITHNQTFNTMLWYIFDFAWNSTN